MKKILKTILITIIIILTVILLDTIQARIFKHSPIISYRQSLEDKDSYVDRGILIDTYYCTKEKDIVTVSWKFKTSKFTCPIDEIYISEIVNPEGISMIIKEGSLTKTTATIIIIDTTGKDNTYGSSYRIDEFINNKWSPREIIFKGNHGWTSIGYLVGDDNKLEMNMNWEKLYGELDKGKYRIVKEVNNKYLFVEFQID